jgi:sucrose phosphorylase
MTVTDRSKHHALRPNYQRKIFTFNKTQKKEIISKLTFLYGSELTDVFFPELERVVKVYYAHKNEAMIKAENSFKAEERFTEEDVILITYGDLIREKNKKPLETMKTFAKTYLKDVFNTLHILPFYPYSSDRGFAVMDFKEVDPNLGGWEDILDIKTDFKLMFDGVFNHASSQSRWFQEFLNQNPMFENFFTVFSTKNRISADHLKLIVRPRTSDVLSGFDTLGGPRMVWTTFSSDQVDLNYKNPAVLVKIIDVLLTYVRRGADIIRLDAVTYLWEELGTCCAHLEQSHTIIKLFRTILDAVAPHVALITETNVPHKDNIKYFSNGYDEAQMVYNFALPPLALHTFITEDAAQLTRWAASLKKVSNQATYFNFLDSHDGIGVMAVKDILTEAEIEIIVLNVLERGGYISFKDNGDGSVSPYELNITWWNAINNENEDEDKELQVQRYIASRAISLVLMGVPGIYLHGLLGSKNDAELVLEEKQTRSINRKNILFEELLRSLDNEESTTRSITTKLIELIRIRISEKAFHPNAAQKIINAGRKTFTVLRTPPNERSDILSVINVSADQCEWRVDLTKHGLSGRQWNDIITRKNYTAKDGILKLNLKPYDIIWLKNKTN